MSGNNFSFYVKTHKKDIIALFHQLATEGKLSDFITEAVEMHHRELLRKKLEHHRVEVKYWETVQLTIEEAERLQTEEEERERLGPWIQQCKVVEEIVNQLMAYEKVEPDYHPNYENLVARITEEGGPSITGDQLIGIHKRRLTGEVINYLEELMTKEAGA